LWWAYIPVKVSAVSSQLFVYPVFFL
jgi:hypothetical protein